VLFKQVPQKEKLSKKKFGEKLYSLISSFYFSTEYFNQRLDHPNAGEETSWTTCQSTSREIGDKREIIAMKIARRARKLRESSIDN